MSTCPRSAAFALLLLLTGCAALGGSRERLTVYSPRLHPPAVATAARRVDWQLVVEVPLASDALDTQRILVMPKPGVLQVYKGARWRDRAPAMLQGILVEAFEQSGRIVGVGSAVTGLRADFALATELRDFQAEYENGTPHVRIGLNVKLIDRASNRALAAHVFRVDTATGASDVGSVAATFEQALNQVLPQIVDWTLAQGSTAWKEHRADHAPSPQAPVPTVASAGCSGT